MKNLLYIGNKLSKHGNNTTSIETLGLFLENEGYTVFYASSKKNKLFRLFDMIFKTIQFRNRVQFVLIDVYSTNNFWYAFIISKLCHFLKLKYIPKLHGGNLPKRFKNNPKLCHLIFNNAYLNIVPSNYLLLACKEFGYSNMLYVPNTIDISIYNYYQREIIHPKLLWVRSFDKIYNPIMAVKVLVELKKEFPTASLCMVGSDKDGSLDETMQFAKDNNVNIDFPGKLSKEDWVELSKEYDIFINTTHFDNTPVSLIEAMSLGLPIISTNVGGIPFLIKDNETGLLVNDNDVDEMVNAIKVIIADKDLAKNISKNARDLAESFDWGTVKKLWFKILE